MVILKHVRNRYYDITVTVSCKAHAQAPRAVLYKEGRRVDGAAEETEGEVATAVDRLPFSDDSFKVYRDEQEPFRLSQPLQNLCGLVKI